MDTKKLKTIFQSRQVPVEHSDLGLKGINLLFNESVLLFPEETNVVII